MGFPGLLVFLSLPLPPSFSQSICSAILQSCCVHISKRLRQARVLLDPALHHTKPSPRVGIAFNVANLQQLFLKISHNFTQFIIFFVLLYQQQQLPTYRSFLRVFYFFRSNNRRNAASYIQINW